MPMPKIIVLGAGLGGTIAAYEIRDAVKGKAEVMVVNDQDDYWFVPSNPWVAVRWREPEAIKVHLPPIMKRKGIGFTSIGARRVHPAENRVELNDGTSLAYDYLVIATGPELAFDEIEGLGPDGYTQSVCRTDHAAHAADAFDRFCEDPKPIVIETTPQAGEVFDALASTVDAELGKPDETGRSLWARAEEKACRLALIYALVAEALSAYYEVLAADEEIAARERAALIRLSGLVAREAGRLSATARALAELDALLALAEVAARNDWSAPLVDDGGTLAIVAECPDGIGPLDVVNDAIFRIGVLPRLPPGASLVLVSGLPADEVRATLLRPAASAQALLDAYPGDALIIPRASKLLLTPT